MIRSNHTYPIGLLMKHWYGGKSADYNYVTPLLKYLLKADYKPSEAYRYLLGDRKGTDTSLVSITVVEFVVMANAPKLVDEFHILLTEKYKIKLLGGQKQLLGFLFKYDDDGSINLSHPQLKHTTMENTYIPRGPSTWDNDIHPYRQDPPQRACSMVTLTPDLLETISTEIHNWNGPHIQWLTILIFGAQTKPGFSVHGSALFR